MCARWYGVVRKHPFWHCIARLCQHRVELCLQDAYVQKI